MCLLHLLEVLVRGSDPPAVVRADAFSFFSMIQSWSLEQKRRSDDVFLKDCSISSRLPSSLSFGFASASVVLPAPPLVAGPRVIALIGRRARHSPEPRLIYRMYEPVGPESVCGGAAAADGAADCLSTEQRLHEQRAGGGSSLKEQYVRYYGTAGTRHEARSRNSGKQQFDGDRPVPDMYL